MDTYSGNNEDPLSLHKYLYCQDSPVDYTDPSGNLSTVETLTTVDIGLSLAASAITTYSIAEALVGARTYAALKSVGSALRVPVITTPPDPDDAQYKYFLHGTSTGSWGNSIRIDPEDGFRTDFGRGFYTFQCNPLGYYWAATWAQKQSGVPFVLVVRMPKSDYGGLSKLDFNDPTYRSLWQPFVRDCRAGNRQYANKDLVIGPLARFNRESEQWVQRSDITIDQYKFESGGINKLQFYGIMPAITMREAGF
jgi:hypothetical protein